MKKLSLVLSLILGSILLTGCGAAKLSTSKTNYKAEGLVAAVKATTNSNSKVSYTIDDGSSKTANNESGTAVIQIPSATKAQTVKITAKDGNSTKSKTVTIAGEKSLGTYSEVAVKFNGILTQLKQTDNMIPMTTKDGVQYLLKTKNYDLRANVQGGELMGMAVITPLKTLKSKTGAADFGQTFAYLASALGADGKKVMKSFTKMADADSDSQTTIDTITSKGIDFNVGVSSSDIYIYITK